MMAAWALCLILAAGETSSAAQDPTPPALRALLETRPELLPHHQGYLKTLARFPDLAASERTWLQVGRRPALREGAARFEERLGSDDASGARFDAYYDQLLENPELRNAVENLLRTELDGTRQEPTIARAVQYLRANPDLAMRFLENPSRVRPLPEALAGAYDDFVAQPDWRESLRGALGDVLERPDAHIAILPWWGQLEALSGLAEGDGAGFAAELHAQPQAMWLWHLRNINLARDRETRPWIRYWNQLIQRDPELARQYGPFVTGLLRDPETLRQHLADLQARQSRDSAEWPPRMKPPMLPPREMAGPVERLKRGMARPTIDKPARPELPRVDTPPRPPRPERPVFPEFPSPGGKRVEAGAGESRPVFPTFPTMPKPEAPVERGTDSAEE